MGFLFRESLVLGYNRPECEPDPARTRTTGSVQGSFTLLVYQVQIQIHNFCSRLDGRCGHQNGHVLDKGAYNFSKPTLRCRTKWSQSIFVPSIDIFVPCSSIMRAILHSLVGTPRPKLMELTPDVTLLLFWAVKSAPCSISMRAAYTCPRSDARCNGDSPLLFQNV
jgi:hypothetical protein